MRRAQARPRTRAQALATQQFEAILQGVHEVMGGIPNGTHRFTLNSGPRKGITQYVLTVDGESLTIFTASPSPTPFDDRSLDIRMTMDEITVRPLASVQ